MGGRVLGTVGTNSSGSPRRPEALLSPHQHTPCPKRSPAGDSGLGLRGMSSQSRWETPPLSCQAQGAKTSQEMGPCASLSISQERAGHRNEPHPLPRGPQAPWKCSSSLATWARTYTGRWAPPGVLWSPGQPESGSPAGALAEGSLSHPDTCTLAFRLPQPGSQASLQHTSLQPLPAP